MRKDCICTIICSNYIAYARTLHQSLEISGHKVDFFAYIVDREGPGASGEERFKVISPTDIFEPSHYRRYAFLFNALELSTNVKPALLRHLLKRGYTRVIYFDPDIFVYGGISSLFKEIDGATILLTPHALHPYLDDLRPSDQDLLKTGVYNLGFIGLYTGAETDRFLSWWEKRCLSLGYCEPRNGLMVDQKWVDLAPCFFRGVKVLRKVGCNVAYWNLHERKVAWKKGGWAVNGEERLSFFHFSGIKYDQSLQVSKHQNRYDLEAAGDLKRLFDEYRKQLVRNGIESTIRSRYAYDYFDNGVEISDLARKMYHWYQDEAGDDPFRADSCFYKWLHRLGMLGRSKGAEVYNSRNLDPEDIRLKTIHAAFRTLLRLAGIKYYQMIMKYLGFVSTLRNQNNIFAYHPEKDRSRT